MLTICSADGYVSGMRLAGLLQLLMIRLPDIFKVDAKNLDLSSSSNPQSSLMSDGVNSVISYFGNTSLQLNVNQLMVTKSPPGEVIPRTIIQKIIMPGSLPMHQPSSQPTNQTTAQPNNQPTLQPSSLLIIKSSGRPTRTPTSQPSTQPSGQPSGLPTKLPTHHSPTGPTSQPSAQPTSQPTSRPFIIRENDLLLLQRSFVYSILVSVLCCALCVCATLYCIEKYDAQIEVQKDLPRTTRIVNYDLEAAVANTASI